ncbi:RNA helicase, partial [Aphelenchoides avenae]
ALELRRSSEQARFDEVQLDNLKTMVASKGRACIMDAPSGTGKTDLCTEFIAESLTRDWVKYGARESFPLIVFKSNANLVNAIRIMKEHIPGFRPVLLVSTSAGERLDDCDITPEEFRTFASRSILRDREGFIRAHITSEDRIFLEDYLAKHDAHPRRSYCEQKALGLLLKYFKPSAVFATSSTLEVYADVLCDNATHMVIDDGGQFDIATVLCLLCKFPKLEQLVISGDSRQLDNYLKGIPEELWKYGGHTVMSLIAKGFAIAVMMNRNYRSARVLSDALSHAAYHGTLEHADGHPPTPDPDWRRDLMPRLPNPDVPILLVDIRGRQEFAHYGTSRVNYEEQEVVLELVKRLRNILGDRVTIAVLSPYLAQTIEMKLVLEGYRCFVRTVDSFVGQVADIVILSTVQSWVETEDDVEREKRLLEHNEFFTHVGRALSAISRPVHAFFMVGNMDAIAVNAVYRRFLEFARLRTTVMKGEFFGVCDAGYEEQD